MKLIEPQVTILQEKVIAEVVDDEAWVLCWHPL